MTALAAPRAFLFDLDGTLADSYEAIRLSVNHVRGLHGLEPLSVEAVRASVGNGLIRLLELTVPSGDLETNAAAFKHHHAGVLREGTRLLPGVRATLQALASRGCYLGVCSNKPEELTAELLRLMEIDHRFGVVLGPESVARRKPDPDMLLEAARRLGVSPDEVVYVGDMTIDISAGRAAGMRVWVIASGSHSAETLAAAGPDRIMERFDELLDLVPALSGRADSSR